MAKFVSIGTLLDRSLKRTGAGKLVTSTQILEKFDGLCYKKWGNKTKDKIKAMYVKDRVLTIACLSSAIAQEVQLNSHLFIKEINNEFGAVVEKIRFLS